MDFLKSMFSIYGLIVALGLATAHWRGWSLDQADEVRGLPRSIRDNPGAYRQHYGGRSWSWGGGGGGGGGRYTGGK